LETHVFDPVITRADANPESEAMVADSVGLALLVVLETLEPAERLAFVLHDVFVGDRLHDRGREDRRDGHPGGSRTSQPTRSVNSQTVNSRQSAVDSRQSTVDSPRLVTEDW
jgi:hypothetical protein